MVFKGRAGAHPCLPPTRPCVKVAGDYQYDGPHEQFPHPLTGPGPGPGPGHLARLTGGLGLDVMRSCWREVTGRELPAGVFAYAQANLRSEQEGR